MSGLPSAGTKGRGVEPIDRAVAEQAAALLPAEGSVLAADGALVVAALAAARATGKRLAVRTIDAAAAAALRAGEIAAVLVVAERIAANGDTRAPVGSYGVALAAAHHGVPFYVAGPRAAVDLGVARDTDLEPGERELVPGRLVGAIATEVGVARPPYEESLADLLTRPLLLNLGSG
jgi:methylthioribose-1-phosphate isomerase